MAAVELIGGLVIAGIFAVGVHRAVMHYIKADRKEVHDDEE